MRLGSSPILVWLLFQYRYREALAAERSSPGLPIGSMDMPRAGWERTEQSGVVLDPLADKALLVTLFVALGVLRLIPLWMLVLAIGRDLIIVGGALLLRIFRGKQRFLPSHSSAR